MKRAQLLGIGVAGGAGLLAFVAMQASNQPPPEPVVQEVQLDRTEVLVAKDDIQLGQITEEGNFRWQTWPRDAISPSYITQSGGTTTRDLAGSIARAPVLAGEPITTLKLIKAGQGGVLAAILPAGMRAISTRIKDETAAGRLILPNDRVDVILIRRVRGRGGSEEYVSDTLFRNVRVLAIGQQIENQEGKKSAELAANTATLELTPKQSEVLALANSMGEITLSLRSIADTAAQGSSPSTGDEFNKKSSNAIRVLRYGVRSRAYGVN